MVSELRRAGDLVVDMRPVHAVNSDTKYSVFSTKWAVQKGKVELGLFLLTAKVPNCARNVLRCHGTLPGLRQSIWNTQRKCSNSPHLSNTTWSISSRQYTVSALAHTKFPFKTLYLCVIKTKYPADILVEQEKRVTVSNPIQGFEEALQCLKGPL